MLKLRKTQHNTIYNSSSNTTTSCADLQAYNVILQQLPHNMYMRISPFGSTSIAEDSEQALVVFDKMHLVLAYDGNALNKE